MSSDNHETAAPSPPSQGPEALKAVVGIGASAGGLPALERFLSAVTPGGIAYLVVQHLSPEHVSILPQILAAACRLPVEAVQDGVVPLADSVYVIPPNTSLVVRDGRLRLEPPEPRILRHPIDLLFRSLAEDLGPRAVAVVMSGTGSDGSGGLRAVKRAGGLTLVQTPGETEYDAMPRAALATGDVDYVVPAAEMPSVIAREIQRRAAEGPSRPPARADGDELQAIARAVRSQTGHDLSAYKRSTLRRRVQRRLDVLRVSDLGDYLQRVERDEREAEALVSEMLIGVTQFFRDMDAFQALSTEVAPTLLERAALEPVRVWVPGCATGEEAYSIAIVLREEARRRGRSIPLLQVFATDIDEDALGVARTGFYPASVARDVSPELLEAYFVSTRGGYEVVKDVRDGVIFSMHDVLSDPPFSRLDLVSCRNLLIYFHPAVQQRLIPLFHYALRPKGHLFLGSAEMVDERSDLLEPVDRKHRIYVRRELDRPPTLPLPIATAIPARRPLQPRPRAPAPAALPAAPPMLQAALLALLDASGAALALVDRSGEVQYFAGPISRFLPTPTGAPTASLLLLAPPPLRTEIACALDTAVAEGREIRRSVTLTGDPERRAELLVRPAPQRDLSLVLFRDVEPPPEQGAQTGSDAERSRLEEELRYVTERWHSSTHLEGSASEQLRSANEELQTMNEELQSANEELQVSQEELQSVNQELHTVNAELNRKVDELNGVNSDLRNLLQSTRIATLFLDRDLRIARFTPAAAELFPVSERDAGRPLADLTNPFAGGDVPALVRAALERARVEERVVALADRPGHYLVRALPYRRHDGAIDGAVVTFVDVSELKRAELALQESEERFRLLVDGVKDVAIFMLAPDGTVATWNQGAARLKGWAREEIVGRHFSCFFTSEDAAARKPWRLLERATAEGTVHDEGWRLRRDGARYWATVVITALRDDAGRLRGFGKILRDITERKRMEDELKEVDRRKSEFLGVLSHELRNPLSAIGTSLYLLSRAAPGGEQLQRNLAVADRQVRHLGRLTDDLLDVTRITSGKIRLQREQVDLAAVARRTADDYRQLFATAGVELEIAAPEDPVHVNVDPARLTQMIGNLLHNAAKFSGTGGRTVLSVERSTDGSSATIAVRDNGIGIAPEVLSRLFIPFVQAERLIDRNPGGLGLGLALVKGFAELHGGQVSAFSEGEGLGSTFVVRLPLDRRKAPRLAVLPPPAKIAPRRILLIEDNTDAAATLAEALELEGHQVQVAHSGPEGLEKARACMPEVILCDIGLPGMDGFQVARRIRAQPALQEVRLVALTGYAQAEDVERAREAGFDLHLAKPPKMDLLLRAIAERPTAAAS